MVRLRFTLCYIRFSDGCIILNQLGFSCQVFVLGTFVSCQLVNLACSQYYKLYNFKSKNDNSLVGCGQINSRVQRNKEDQLNKERRIYYWIGQSSAKSVEIQSYNTIIRIPLKILFLYIHISMFIFRLITFVFLSVFFSSTKMHLFLGVC